MFGRRLGARLGARVVAAGCVVAAMAAGSLLITPSAAAAKSASWGVDLSPLVLTAGKATTVTVMVTAGQSTKIGCVLLTVPAGFTVLKASAPAPWVVQPILRGPPAVVQFNVTTDPQRLDGSPVRFAVTVVATAPGLGAWTAASYQKFDAESKSNGAPTSPLILFVLTPAPTPKPTPTPTPKPTPTPTPIPTPTAKPTPRPTAAPTPRPTAAPTPRSTAAPTASPTPRPAPTSTPTPTATPTDGPTASPSPTDASPSPSPVQPAPDSSWRPTAQPRSTPTPAAPVGPAVGGGPSGHGGSSIEIPILPSGVTVSITALGPLAGFGLLTWVVPGFFLGLPGLLILVVVAAQMLGGAIFVPITRRALGAFGFRGRRRSTRSGS